MKKKKTYSTPLTAVTSVMLESPICGGSADIANPDSEQGRIESQTINSDFSSDSFNTGNWTEEK